MLASAEGSILSTAFGKGLGVAVASTTLYRYAMILLPPPTPISRSSQVSRPPAYSKWGEIWQKAFAPMISILIVNILTAQVVVYNETSSANFAVDIYVHYGSPCSSTGFAYQGCVPTAPSSTNPYTLNSGEYLETVKVRCATTCTGTQVTSAVCSGSNMNFQCGGSGPWYTVLQVDNEVRIAEQ